VTGSVGRLTKLQPHMLNAAQAELYAAMTGGPRGGGNQPFQLVDDAGALAGPFNAMLLEPAVGEALQALGAALRYRGSLPARARELAILIVAAHTECEFEQYAHEAAGRRAGLSEEDLAAIRAGQAPDLADPAERALVDATWTLARTGDLTDEQYAAAEAELGQAALFELTTLVGYYSTLALQLRVFRVETPR
jgi:4-carboxymuconolactone decarboxylase